ncbi:MAG: hypothetical protein ACKVUS_03995 [Saprospiraceae bacterium]
MTIEQFAAANPTISVANLLNDRANHALAFELQWQLTKLGLLDPLIGASVMDDFEVMQKQDGEFGRESRLALSLFCDLVGLPYQQALTAPIAQALLDAEARTLLPLNFDPLAGDTLTETFAKRILRYMRDKDYWIARHPQMINIVYLEGANPGGQKNADEDNSWNDLRLLLKVKSNGQPEVFFSAVATTEPSKSYAQKIKDDREVRNNLSNPYAARIAFGQYKAWNMGQHIFSNGSAQPALKHNWKFPVLVHRDKDASGTRNSRDIMDWGLGINQHTTYVNESPRVGTWSTGCLVGHKPTEHTNFLELLKTDIRLVSNAGYTFMTTIIAGDKLQAEQPMAPPA